MLADKCIDDFAMSKQSSLDKQANEQTSEIPFDVSTEISEKSQTWTEQPLKLSEVIKKHGRPESTSKSVEEHEI